MSAINLHEVKLSQLCESLDRALKNQEYHRLLTLDEDIRRCVSDAVSGCAGNDDAAKQRVAQKIKALQALYSDAVTLCQERSFSLKSQLGKVKQGKSGANSYLQVAGRTG